MFAEAAASTAMRAERRGNRQPAVVSSACAKDGTVAAQLLWAEVPDGERTSAVAWTRPGGGTGGAQALQFDDGRAKITAAGRWLDQAVRADAATVELDGMEPLVFDTRRHRLELAEFRDRCPGMADANGKPMRTASRCERQADANGKPMRTASRCERQADANGKPFEDVRTHLPGFGFAGTRPSRPH